MYGFFVFSLLSPYFSLKTVIYFPPPLSRTLLRQEPEAWKRRRERRLKKCPRQNHPSQKLAYAGRTQDVARRGKGGSNDTGGYRQGGGG